MLTHETGLFLKLFVVSAFFSGLSGALLVFDFGTASVGTVVDVAVGVNVIVAAVLGVLATVGIDLQQGMPWQQAVLYGLYAAGLAVFGHQVVVEGALKGVEWMPATKAVRAARATIPPPPASPSKPPPPVAPPPPAAA